MATSKSGNKSIRQAAARRVFNVRRLRAMRDSTKTVTELARAKDKKGAEAILPQAYKAIDKAVKKGVIKKNTAARRKSKLAKSVTGA